MQTSRVRRPQSARAPGAPQRSATGGEVGSDLPARWGRGVECAGGLARRSGAGVSAGGACASAFYRLKASAALLTLNSGLKATFSQTPN